jgi:hypothetical protein
MRKYLVKVIADEMRQDEGKVEATNIFKKKEKEFQIFALSSKIPTQKS